MKILKSSILSLALAACSFAQLNTFTTTTLSSAVTATQTSFTVASATGISAPSLASGTSGTNLYTWDGELMQVTAISGTLVSVQRGWGGTKAFAHASGILVFIGNADWYFSYFPGSTFGGTCTKSALYAYPAIQVLQHQFHVCSDGNAGYGGPSLSDGQLAMARTAVAANYTALPWDLYIGYTATGSAFTLTLPAASTLPGKVYIIVDESNAAATHNITVTTASGCAAITANGGSCRVRSNGTSWFAF